MTELGHEKCRSLHHPLQTNVTFANWNDTRTNRICGTGNESDATCVSNLFQRSVSSDRLIRQRIAFEHLSDVIHRDGIPGGEFVIDAAILAAINPILDYCGHATLRP